MSERQLFVFWQFAGDNYTGWCNQQCGYFYTFPNGKHVTYCYGTEHKLMRSLWNHDADKWEKALERLDTLHDNKGLYIVFSYGESAGMDGFYECLDIIGKHPTWSLCIVTNLSLDPTRMINTKVALDGRLMLHPCWHPYGMADMDAGWENFKKNLLLCKAAKIPLQVLYLWWPPQISLFPKFFKWLDDNDFRVIVRRYVDNIGGFKVAPFKRWFGGKNYPHDYTEAQKGFLYANNASGKVQKYGLDLVSPYQRECSAMKNLILVRYNGDVSPCADTEELVLGNVFDENFQLSASNLKCPTYRCGGDYGMLHLCDCEFPDTPKRLPNEPFVSIVENLKQASPVPYPYRKEMFQWLNKL